MKCREIQNCIVEFWMFLHGFSIRLLKGVTVSILLTVVSYRRAQYYCIRLVNLRNTKSDLFSSRAGITVHHWIQLSISRAFFLFMSRQTTRWWSNLNVHLLNWRRCLKTTKSGRQTQIYVRNEVYSRRCGTASIFHTNSAPHHAKKHTQWNKASCTRTCSHPYARPVRHEYADRTERKIACVWLAKMAQSKCNRVSTLIMACAHTIADNAMQAPNTAAVSTIKTNRCARRNAYHLQCWMNWIRNERQLRPARTVTTM